MASTVTSIISTFRTSIYPDCDATSAQALFDEAHKTILQNIQVRNSTATINLTAGTRQYDLSESIVKIHEAYYEVDATTSFALEETSTDQLARFDRGWRSVTETSQPTQYYLTSAVTGDTGKLQIGFVAIPDTTTSGGYPRVVLYTTDYAQLTGSDTVPNGLKDDDVYLFYMARQWAIRTDRERYLFWFEMFKNALADNQAFVNARQAQNEYTIIMSPFARGQSLAI